jgi:hypothetical protein
MFMESLSITSPKFFFPVCVFNVPILSIWFTSYAYSLHRGSLPAVCASVSLLVVDSRVILPD